MKKHLLILLCDNPANPCGGLGERFRHLLPHLEQHYNITLCCVGPAGDRVGGVVMHQWQRKHHISMSPAAPLLFLEFVAEVMRNKSRPDIILAADHWAMRPAVILSRLYDCKLVTEFDLAVFSYEKIYDPADLGPYNTAYAEFMKDAEKTGIEAADTVITCSEAYAKAIPWPVKCPVVAVPNGIDTTPYEKEYEPYYFAGDRPINLVFLGRLNMQKGVAALASFRELPDNVSLHFVGGERGSDQYKQVLSACERSKRTGNQQLFHIPFVYGVDKYRIMKSASAALIPSVHEPFGIVALEFAAARTPIISTMVDGLGDFLDDTTAISCRATSEDCHAFLEDYQREWDAAKGQGMLEPKEVVKRFEHAILVPNSIERAVKEFLVMPKADVTAMTDRAFVVAKKYTWDIAADKMLTVLNNIENRMAA